MSNVGPPLARLEFCIMQCCEAPACEFAIDFDDVAHGKRNLSSGVCPNCGRATIYSCPYCSHVILTRDFIRASLACRYCKKTLNGLSAERRFELAIIPVVRGQNAHLTPREIQVVKLLAAGRCNKEVSTILEISVDTVETYRARIMSKTDLHSIVELVHYAIQQNLLSLRQSL
jgi:DNA-binding CsgD family transcriptional regulator